MCVREQEGARTCKVLDLHTHVSMCAMSMEMPVCVCDRCMIHSVTTVRSNDWTSWAETTAIEVAFSWDTQANTLTKSHLTGPSYRKWKRKPLVHPVLHPSLCSALHVKSLLATIAQYEALLLQNNREKTGSGWNWFVIWGWGVRGQASDQLTFNYGRLATIITVKVEFTDWTTVFKHLLSWSNDSDLIWAKHPFGI